MKKVCADALKWVRGYASGVRGALGCEGAMRLQTLHLLCCDAMSVVISGQKIEDSAPDIVDVVH